jgi:hypothetical protein
MSGARGTQTPTRVAGTHLSLMVPRNVDAAMATDARKLLAVAL